MLEFFKSGLSHSLKIFNQQIGHIRTKCHASAISLFVKETILGFHYTNVDQYLFKVILWRELCRFSLDAGQLISGAHGIHKDKRTNGDIITVSLTLSIVMAFCRKLERDIFI